MEIHLDNYLPEYPSFVSGIRRAPDRGYSLTPAQTETALMNALRYIPVELHEKLAPEFMEELLTIWKHIQLDKEFNEWHLYIVGDGKDKSFYLDFTRNNNIPNVHFEGRRYPIPYYKRASIFAMTSAFEGFPMSIIEAQQNGVVPIVMDSFLSVHDIIDNDVNGVLISYGNTTMFAESLKSLMKDEMQRNKLAIKGLETCRRFNIETVVDRWEEIFEKMR